MRNRHAERSSRKIFFRIFAVIAAVILIWVIFFLPDSGNKSPNGEMTDTLAINDGNTIPAEVSDFITFVKLASDTIVSEETKEYAGLGIEQLSIALESFIERNASNYHSLSSQTNEMKSIAGEIENADAGNASEKAREAFLIAAEVFEDIRGENKPDSLKQKAEQIREDVAINDQLENVKDYFLYAADALRQMTGMEDKSML